MPVDLEPMEWTRVTLSLIDGIQSRYFLEIDGMGEDRMSPRIDDRRDKRVGSRNGQVSRVVADR